MTTRDPNIERVLKELNELLIEKNSYQFASGYMESLMVSVLTVFVPARDRARMLDFINMHKEGHENEKL